MNDHRNPIDRRKACKWAASLLADHRHVVVIDTETTGFKKTDEIVQISIKSLDGQDLCSTLVAMTKRKSIPREASDIHGIKKADLEGKPTYATLSPMLQRVLSGKKIIAYNAEFDFRMMHQVYDLAGGYKPIASQWECAMKQYAAFVGEWNDYHNDYKWQKLGGSHDARGDVDKTIELIEEMADFLAQEKKHDEWRMHYSTKLSEYNKAARQIQITDFSVFGTKTLHKLLKNLDSTGLPAGIFFLIGGLLISLISLFGFGSIQFAALTFCLSCAAGLGLFLLSNRSEEKSVEAAKTKKAGLEIVLKQKEKELAVLRSKEPRING